MVWRNTDNSYGLVAVLMHWLVAVATVGLFAIGLWMTNLTYYDPWYKRLPELHKGVGVLLFAAMLLRLAWRYLDPQPSPLATLSALERAASAVTHVALYALLFSAILSGYLISTADGRPIDVFGLFQVPATLMGLPNQADIAGKIHFALAIATITLAAVHVLAALKHHFVDGDRTLLRMLGLSKR
ncbi:MAG: cytochrome b [Pseudomonadota bacterium]|nr:cytochrome b [Pseudomonadota bacterium]